MSARKLLYLPHILNVWEKYIIAGFLLVFFASGGALLTRLYFSLTVPIPDIGGSYVEGVLREPQTINPLFAIQDTDRDLVKLVYAGLFTYSGSGTLEPDLAENLEISDNGKTYTITLKKNLTWQDGKALGADDVVFTIQAVQNPQYRSALRANWQGVTVEKAANDKIRFILRTPYSPFIENLTIGLLPKHLWENIAPGEAQLHELNLKPIGAGPYRFYRIRYAKDGSLSSYEMRRNPSYHREGPYLERITFKFFKTGDEILGALRKGTIDGFGSATEEQHSLLGEEKTRMARAIMPRIFGIFFNEKKNSIFAEKPVREAVARALDRQIIAARASQGNAIPHASPLPPTAFILKDQMTESTDQVAAQAPPPYEPEEAKRLLENAGWTDKDGDGLREKENRQKGKTTLTPLRFTITTSDWPELVRAAEAIKEELNKVGIDASLDSRPFPQLESEVLRPRNFEVLLFGEVYGYEPDPFPFWHSSQMKDPGLNVALYSRKEVDRILEEARKTSDRELRAKKYAEFETHIGRDLPAVFLYSQLYLHLFPANLEGMEIRTIALPADRFNEVNKWYRETQRILKR